MFLDARLVYDSLSDFQQYLTQEHFIIIRGMAKAYFWKKKSTFYLQICIYFAEKKDIFVLFVIKITVQIMK